MSSNSSASPLARVATFFAQMPLAVEIVLWILLAAVIVGMRVFLWHLVPAYIWSDDSFSYAAPAFRWFNTGQMIFDGRRGPTYTLLIAIAIWLWKSVQGVVWLQQGLAGVAAFVAALTARSLWGRAAALPVFICGLTLAVHGVPLYLCHVIRNEGLLFIFSSFAFGAWWLALKSNRLAWFFLAALATALLTMTKSVFVAFPPMVALGVLLYAGPGWRSRVLRFGMFLAGFALPYVAVKIHNATSKHVDLPAPQSGILFYGRTAQWTKLDGGIEQDLKNVIREDIIDYRGRKKLDNNIIIKRTAIPHLWATIQARGGTPTELDKICRKFAIEAVRDQPAAFRKQVWNDLIDLHWRLGWNNDFPNDKLIEAGRLSLDETRVKNGGVDVMDMDEVNDILNGSMQGDRFRLFHDFLGYAWLFQYHPVLLTTVAIPLLLLFTRGRIRFFFLTVGAVWYSNMLLLSTVGRPLERYLMPLVPLTFWTLSGVIIVAWLALLRLAGAPRDESKPAASPEPAAP